MLADLHSHSVLFAISDISRLSDEQIIQEIGQPDGSRVVRHDRKGPAGPEAPMFQFWDKRLPWGEMRRNPQIRIIDFGEAL